MNANHARRIRFGILAARHEGDRWRMTWDQVDYLEHCVEYGWAAKDSRKAYEHEWKSIRDRADR